MLIFTVLISCEVQTRYLRTLKYCEQYIWDHLSGTKVRIWICSEYDAVFSFSCIALCNLTKSFALSQESNSESSKQSTCTLYASEILLFTFFINAWKLTSEIPIEWTFFFGVWHSVNSFSVSATDWNISWSSIQWVCL